MRLYLDDDSASPLLARLLRSAGHDVQPVITRAHWSFDKIMIQLAT